MLSQNHELSIDRYLHTLLTYSFSTNLLPSPTIYNTHQYSPLFLYYCLELGKLRSIWKQCPSFYRSKWFFWEQGCKYRWLRYSVYSHDRVQLWQEVHLWLKSHQNFILRLLSWDLSLPRASRRFFRYPLFELFLNICHIC